MKINGITALFFMDSGDVKKRYEEPYKKEGYAAEKQLFS